MLRLKVKNQFMKRIFGIVLGVVMAGFAVAQTASVDKPVRSQHRWGLVFGNHTVGGSFNVDTRGKIELTDDDKDVKSMSADGYLEINKITFGSRRSIIITPLATGVRREYYEGREKMPFEPEGRQWLGEVLPELVRSTTIAAESRVTRYYRTGGINALLDEVDRLTSDHVKAHYGSLLGKLNLSATDWPLAITRITNSIESDHYRTEFLEGNMNRITGNKEALSAVLAASGKMESDHYKTQVIKSALSQQGVTMEGTRQIMTVVSDMESDHYRTEVLSGLLRRDNLTDAMVAEILAVTKRFESDHYRTQVLSQALAKSGLSAASFQRALESVETMESDHYKTEVLTDLLRGKLNEEMDKRLIGIASNLDSDHYRSIVLTTMLDRQELSDLAFSQLISQAAEGESDHYASIVLVHALETPGLSEAKVMSVLTAAPHLNSDHYLAEVLTRAAGRVRNGSAALKEAYRTAAKSIDSEVYYARALRAVE